MATEPAKLPRWATVPATDPVSGQPNVSEPSEGKKDSGYDFQERPPRQDFNWLFNLIYLWIQWFQQEINESWSEDSSPVIDAGAGTWVDGGSYIRWSKIGNGDVIRLKWKLAGTLSVSTVAVIKMQLTNVTPIGSTNELDIEKVISYSQSSVDGEEVCAVVPQDATTRMDLAFDRLGVSNWSLAVIVAEGEASYKVTAR